MANTTIRHERPVVPELRSLDTLYSAEPADPQSFDVGFSRSSDPEAKRVRNIRFDGLHPSVAGRSTGGLSFIFGIHKLIVPSYNWGLFEEAVRDLCNRTSGQSWNEVGNILNRYAHWEFEDYEENPWGEKARSFSDYVFPELRSLERASASDPEYSQNFELEFQACIVHEGESKKTSTN